MLDIGRSAALHISVRLFNKIICSTFQHHRHEYEVFNARKIHKWTPFHFIHFSLHTTENPNPISLSMEYQTNEKKFRKIKWKKNCFHLYLFFLLFLPFSGFSFSNSIDSCAFGWARQLAYEAIYSIFHYYRKPQSGVVFFTISQSFHNWLQKFTEKRKSVQMK